jgi:LPXTG-site transpeptidase (sortase) family protein
MHAEGLRAGRINPPAGTVMWFNGQGRVAPGEVGTSVIAGHVASGGRPDVFGKLSRVRVGDRVEVTGTDGVARSFRVVRAGVVDKRDLTTDYSVWGPNSSVRRLAIITCDDAFGFRGDGHRVANYVVIAEPA